MATPGADLYRTIIEQAPDAVLFADAQGIIRLWNDGAERIFAISREQAIGQTLDLIIPENMRKRHWEGYYRVMAGGQSRYGTELLRVPALHQDGRQFSSEFSIVLVMGADGTPRGVAAILRDVSAQWRRERELRERLAALATG